MSKANMIKKIYEHFSKPLNLVVLNAVLILLLLLLNAYFQAFCIPTTWTTIILGICFLNTIFYPLLEQTRFAPFTSFISGISFFVFLYCVVFMEQLSLFGLATAFLGIGIIILAPHFFIIQFIWRNLIRPRSKKSRLFFSTSLVMCGLGILFIGQSYKSALDTMQKFEKSNYSSLERSFLTEKTLGMHLIYHTRFCEYDGWRPPKHEPILVIGMWLNGRKDPMHVDLGQRLLLYKTFFPENNYKFECSCAKMYSENYHKDPLWR